MPQINVQVKDAKKLFFQVRGRFLKLQRTIVGDALQAGAQPIVAAARSAAPVLQEAKRGRRPGQIRVRMGAVVVAKGNRVRVDIGPIQYSKRDKDFPFWARWQEKGWKATGRAKRGSAKSSRQIPGKFFLRSAAQSNIGQAFQIWSARVIQGFQEADRAGSAI